MSSKWAPDNADGLHAYIITKRSWGRSWHRIEYAHSLKDAKASFGWTRERYTTVSVRRATPADMEKP
jgi:hypothetical protein